MNTFVVWMDSKRAHIFNLKSAGIDKSTINKIEQDHHTRHKNDKRSDSSSAHYYRDLAAQLKGADQLLIIGPGLAKKHFKDHLTTHLASTLGKKIKGIENFESFEHTTENQLIAKAHKFFKKYNLFNSSI